jgi:hypothetical protein
LSVRPSQPPPWCSRANWFQVRLDLFGIGLVITADVVEQPAREHGAQLVTDVLAGLEAHAVFRYPLDEDLMHALVRGTERIARFLHQLFLEREVRHGVVHHLIDHFTHRRTLHAGLGHVQVVEHLDDAAVLLVDHIDADVQIVLPDQ